MTLIGDNTKASKILGWKPLVGLDEGLKLTIKQLKEKKQHG